MTIEALRKLIKVTGWSLTNIGLTISYEREDAKPKELHLILNPVETMVELSMVGDVEDYLKETEDCPSIILFNDEWILYKDFFPQYKMCQWEALEIAIRHEFDKEISKEIDAGDIGAAIKKLK